VLLFDETKRIKDVTDEQFLMVMQTNNFQNKFVANIKKMFWIAKKFILH